MLIIGVIIFVVVVLTLAFLTTRYRIGKPDEILIVTGALIKDGIKFLKNSGTFVIPIVQKAHKLSLLSHKIEVATPFVPTSQGVSVAASATVIVKIGNSDETIQIAAEQYLGKSDEQMEEETRDVLEGHLRAIIGGMTVESLYNNRDDFAEKVQSVASTDLQKMGLEVVSFTIKDINDEDQYMKALGRPRVAEVKKNANIAESDSERETRIKRAENDQKAQQEEIQRQTEIAEAQKEQALKAAQYEKEREVAIVEATKEQQIAKAKADQLATTEQMQVEIIKQQKNIEIQEKEAELREKELTATVRKDAEARKYVAEQDAAAEKARQIAQAEADARKIELEAEAQANRVTKLGTAEAEKIDKVGRAEAVAKEQMAIALTKLNEAGMMMEVIKILPALAEAVNAPLSNIDKVVSIGGDNDLHSMGKSGLVGTFEYLKEVAGVDLPALMNASLTQTAGDKAIAKALNAKEVDETDNNQ